MTEEAARGEEGEERQWGKGEGSEGRGEGSEGGGGREERGVGMRRVKEWKAAAVREEERQQWRNDATHLLVHKVAESVS